jgi:5,10-methylenetetrahydromethanopterin reductase
MTKVGLYFTHSLPLKDEVRYAKLAEDKGFDCVWQGQSRYHRDSIVPLTAYAALTHRIRLGTGVTHALIRNVVTLAVEFITLDELSHGRAILGISALWDPMAHEIGIDVRRRLQAVEEYVIALKWLFKGELVNFEGDFVKLRGVMLARKPIGIPVYIGATGVKMMRLAGRTADGVVLNYLITPEYTRECVDVVKAAASEVGKQLSEIDRPQLIACSLDNDWDVAVSRLKPMVAEYLAKEPHIAKACGASQEVVEQVRRVVKSSPSEETGFQKAATLVDDDLIKRIAVVGDAKHCRQRVTEYVHSGCTCPLIYSVGENVAEVLEAFSSF